MTEPPRPRFAPLRGIARLALGRPDGLAAFRATPEGLLASLAPLLALPVAACVLLLLGGAAGQALVLVLLAVISQLTPLVLSHAVAARWDRGERWLRYATAYNWCQWAVFAVMLGLLAVLRFAGLGLAEALGSPALTLGAGGYAMWLHWVLARHGLGLPGLRAAALVLLVAVATAALVLGPLLIGFALTAHATGHV